MAQQPGRMQNGQLEQGDGAQNRLEKLEGMIRQISSAIGLDVQQSTVADFETRTTEALKRLQQQPTTASNQDSGVSGRSLSHSSGPSQLDSFITSVDASHSLEHAPLLDLFKATMIIERGTRQTETIQPETPAAQGVQSCINSLKTFLPKEDVLTSIFEATQKFWPLWTPFPRRVFDTSKGDHRNQVTLAKDFILESFGSGCPISIARATLCVALGVQQLPAKFHRHQDLLLSADILIDTYLSSVETLLFFDISTLTIDGIECLPLLAKIYINAGKPRKAWLSFRRAMDFALLLGLNCPSSQTDEHRRGLWTSILQSERHMALIIGVPCGNALSHPSLSNGHANQSAAQRVMEKIAIICGHINARNQDPQNTIYSTAMIEEELKQCRDEIPSEWWDYESSNVTMPLKTLYDTLGIKLKYLELVKYLHLPFMLAPCTLEDQQRSKTAGLNAARQMIKSYQFFRRACGSTFVMCDLLDFLVFTGAVLIIINLLAQSSSINYEQDASDWKLVSDVTKTLDQVSREMECCVAGQAAQLLDYLSTSYQGTYSGPEVYEAVIPYFGKIRIQPAKKSPHYDSTILNAPDNHLTPAYLNSLEFSIGQFPTGNSLSDAELAIDWASILDTDSTTYDWNYVFDNVGSSELP